MNLHEAITRAASIPRAFTQYAEEAQRRTAALVRLAGALQQDVMVVSNRFGLWQCTTVMSFDELMALCYARARMGLPMPWEVAKPALPKSE